ncbi:MAG: LysR family transcriptional regulator [Rhodospirillaceae bacterium]|nr:MAG: LysR family transcriptional regulator [Rhodospirillaceae bacterium]
MPKSPHIRLRFALSATVAMGPGKADLLTHIADTGSIAAAARKMDMSYRRAWLLLADLNSCFTSPVVETAKGGRGGGGGAVLTPLGRDLLKRYRAMVAKTERAVAADFKALSANFP